MDTVIKIKELIKDIKVGDNVVKILSAINLNIRNGEFLAIMGASGSGKSNAFL